MLVLLARVSLREKIEQSHSKKRKTSSALYAARVLCRDFEQNSPERHKATRGGTFFVAAATGRPQKPLSTAGSCHLVAEGTHDQHLRLAWQTIFEAARSKFFCSLQTRPEATDSWGNVARRARWQDLCLDLPESDERASKTAIHDWKELISGMSKLGKRSKMIKTGRHVIQSWYLARISRSEMRMVTTCPRTKSPHESQLFYGSTTEFNGSDAAEK